MHYRQINSKNSAFSMQFDTEFAMLYTMYYLLYGSEIFSDSFFLQKVTVLIKKQKNIDTSNRKEMHRNWGDQKANPALKPKREINKYYKYTKYNENNLLTERAAISQKVATQQPKLN